MLIPSNESN